MNLYLNGRKAVDCHVTFGATKDICDAFLEEAWWDDTGEALTHDELDQLQEANEDLVQEKAMENGGYH